MTDKLLFKLHSYKRAVPFCVIFSIGYWALAFRTVLIGLTKYKLLNIDFHFFLFSGHQVGLSVNVVTRQEC